MRSSVECSIEHCKCSRDEIIWRTCYRLFSEAEHLICSRFYEIKWTHFDYFRITNERIAEVEHQFEEKEADDEEDYWLASTNLPISIPSVREIAFTSITPIIRLRRLEKIKESTFICHQTDSNLIWARETWVKIPEKWIWSFQRRNGHCYQNLEFEDNGSPALKKLNLFNKSVSRMAPSNSSNLFYSACLDKRYPLHVLELIVLPARP